MRKSDIFFAHREGLGSFFKQTLELRSDSGLFIYSYKYMNINMFCFFWLYMFDGIIMFVQGTHYHFLPLCEYIVLYKIYF